MWDTVNTDWDVASPSWQVPLLSFIDVQIETGDGQPLTIKLHDRFTLIILKSIKCKCFRFSCPVEGINWILSCEINIFVGQAIFSIGSSLILIHGRSKYFLERPLGGWFLILVGAPQFFGSSSSPLFLVPADPPRFAGQPPGETQVVRACAWTLSRPVTPGMWPGWKHKMIAIARFDCWRVSQRSERKRGKMVKEVGFTTNGKQWHHGGTRCWGQWLSKWWRKTMMIHVM